MKKNIFRKEATNLSNTDRVVSRNYNLSNLKNYVSNKENSKDNNNVINTDRISSNSNKKKFVIINEEASNPRSIDTNIKVMQNLQECSSSNGLLYKKNKKDKVILNKMKKPLSKYSNNNLEDINKNKVYTSITPRDKNNRLNYAVNRYKEVNKEIYYDKKIENKINYIKDKDIIDRPLLFNQTNFEVIKERGDVENKILELEFFTKKKFDELVKEIKNFIPIHFNSHARDYSVIEIKNKNRYRK